MEICGRARNAQPGPTPGASWGWAGEFSLRRPTSFYPSADHGCQLPSNQMRCKFVLRSRVTTSIRLVPQETAVGATDIWPPRDVQGCQPTLLPLLISYQICCKLASAPRAKTSSRLGPQEATAGADVRLFPRGSQGCQAPSYQMCQRPLSSPRPKASSPFGAQRTAAAAAVM